MIEVRTSYRVLMTDTRAMNELWRQAREVVWPSLGWQGRMESMLHGHAQQSTFVWSSEWENLAAWEAGMARAADSQEYVDWMQAISKMHIFGSEREAFRILEPYVPADNTPGKVEYRSSYTIALQNLEKAEEIMRRGWDEVWPLLKWGGQNQQMLFGDTSQSLFIWSSVWDNQAAYEKGLTGLGEVPEFGAWFGEWKEVVEYGGTREIFKIL